MRSLAVLRYLQQFSASEQRNSRYSSDVVRTVVLGAVLARWRCPGEPEAPPQHVGFKLMQDMLWRAGKSSIEGSRISQGAAKCEAARADSPVSPT
jgi:hypothetical protein